MKVLGYDFITKESIKLFAPKDLCIDDVAVVRENKFLSLPPLKKIFVHRSHKSEGNTHLELIDERTASVADASLPKAKRSVSGVVGKPAPIQDRRRHSHQQGCSTNQQLIQRCVVVTREPEGYGLTVTGDNPVFVQTVKQDGAAQRSGVRQGDRILKVNGMLVTNSNHLEVVRMISSGQTVALTLLGKPMEENVYLQPNVTLRVTPPGQKSPTAFVEPKPVITGPRPVNEEKQAEWRKKRVEIIRQMLGEENKNLEELKTEARRHQNPSEKLLANIEQAEKRIKNLESQVSADTESSPTTVLIVPSEEETSRPTSAIVDTPSSSTKQSNRQSAPPVMSQESLEEFASGATVSAGPVVPEGMHFVTPAQVDVVPMDEDEDEDSAETVVPLDTQGPFSNFADLKTRPAHLAVFLHYLISNSDPASLLFYLITDLYQNVNGKDLKRWAYEIHSTFLIPTAPLLVSGIDHDVYQDIDRALSDANLTGDNDDTLKRLFVKARNRALDDINDHLADFRNKRTLGLGTVFGESMLQGLVTGDRARELKIADALLMPHFESFFENGADFEQQQDRTQGLAAGLATVIKQVLGVKPSCNLHEKLLDKCPTYVTKDKGSKFKIKSMASKKAVQLKGHQFLLNPVTITTFCYQCRDTIWGINPQAYSCSSCEVVLHKNCAGVLEDHCYPATHIKKPLGPKRSKSTAVRLSTRTDSTSDAPVQSPPRKGGTTLSTEEASEDLDKTTDLPGSGSPIAKDWGSKSVSSDSGYGGDTDKSNDKPVSRSQSMRTREDLLRQSKRLAGGDLSNGRRAKSDVDADDKSIALAVGRKPGSQASSSSSSLGTQPGSLTETVTLIEKFEPDSDLEVETEIPRLEETLDWDIIKHLKPKEKKRQEIINELFHTERTHVRNLKVLYRVFYTPMLVHGILSPDFVKLLFANIEEILEIHCRMSDAIKEELAETREKGELYGNIGDLMLEFFDGPNGEKFKNATASFCQHQQYALEALRESTKKENKLQEFLTEAECNTLCRKLQLKDMLPVEMQRLTKYPLLLESAAKYTPEDPSDEVEKVRKAVDLARSVLAAVNTAKRNSENLRSLEELQRKLDTSHFDKENHPVSRQFRGLDLRKYTLLYDGPLSWRLGKNKSIDLHVVLLEEILVLLTRHSDGQKLGLKFHDTSILKDSKWCPLLRLSSLIAKDVATDKKAFFLVSTSALGPQIYELVAHTATEKKRWFKLITSQVELVKKREGQAIEPFDVSKEAIHNDSGVSDASQGDEEGEMVQIVTQPSLVNPNEIQIAQPTILEHAKPILTPAEQLKRNDQMVFKLLTEQQKLLANFLQEGAGVDQLNKFADSLASVEVAELKQHPHVKEVVLSAIVQANRLLEAINAGMRLKQQQESGEQPVLAGPEAGTPSVSCFRLTSIAAPLMKHLTAMLQSMQQNEEELKRIKLELSHYKEICENAVPGAHQLSSSLPSSSDTAPPSRSPMPTDLVRPGSLVVTNPPKTQRKNSSTDKPPPPPSSEPPADSPEPPEKPVVSPPEDDVKRKERRMQKRQRHTALTGVNDPRTSDVSPPERGNGTVKNAHTTHPVS